MKSCINFQNLVAFKVSLRPGRLFAAVDVYIFRTMTLLLLVLVLIRLIRQKFEIKNRMLLYIFQISALALCLLYLTFF